MDGKLLRKNAIYLIILVALSFLFALILFYGSNRIYDLEAQREHEIAIAGLEEGKKIIRLSLEKSLEDLLFLKTNEAMVNYVDSTFLYPSHEKEIEQLFENFVASYQSCKLITIIDSNGLVRLSVLEESATPNRKNNFYDLLQTRENNYFYEQQKTSGDYSANLLIGDEPIISITAPLLNREGIEKGMLFLSRDISELINLFPDNFFLRDEKGNTFGKTEHFAGETIKLETDSGSGLRWLKVSATETIHYTEIDSFTGSKITAGVIHKHLRLRDEMLRLFFFSAIFFFTFLCLVVFIAHFNYSKLKELADTQKGLVYSMVNLAEQRDIDTGKHLERTSMYALELSRELQKTSKYRKVINKNFLEDLENASVLHDIGKVGIPDAILLKKNYLSETEYAQIKKHVEIGKQVLETVINRLNLKTSYLTMGRNIVAYHHEKFDGKGYPEGLKGEEIPLEARIFSLCDAYDAIRSERPYKKSISHEAAVAMLVKDSGTHFDPDIVDAFANCERKFLYISENLR